MHKISASKLHVIEINAIEPVLKTRINSRVSVDVRLLKTLAVFYLGPGWFLG